jgi:hypothetical protein
MSRRALTLAATFLLLPSLSAGQPAGNFRVGAAVGSAWGDHNAVPSIGIVAAYRLAPKWEIELDASTLRKLDVGTFPACPPGVFCFAIPAVIGGSYELRARAVSVVGNLVASIPATTHRMRPYLLAGGGITRLALEQRHDSLAIVSETRTTGWVASFGGGLELVVSRRLSVNLDARRQHVIAPDVFHRGDIRERWSVIRLGSSVSYRF